MATETETARKVVNDFVQLVFIEGRVEDAAGRLLSDSYIQHNPEVATGKQAFIAAIGGMLSAFPDFSYDIKRVIAEGDLVVLHAHVRMTKDDRGTATIDIFRVADGKVAEHWDVLQPVPEKAANENTMF